MTAYIQVPTDSEPSATLATMMIALLFKHGGRAVLSQVELQQRNYQSLGWSPQGDGSTVEVFLIPRDQVAEA